MGSNSTTAHKVYTVAPSVTVPLPEPVAEDVSAQSESLETIQETQGAPVSDVPVDALTPIPDEPPAGLATGVPVLVGGEDLVDSTATLMSYSSAAGPHEVLLTAVTEDAEVKLMEALAVAGTMTVQVTEDATGRLPADEANQLYELTAKAAKSVNHKLSHGEDIPAHTKGYFETAHAAVGAVLDNPDASTEEQAMAAHYAQHLVAVDQRINGETTEKIPQVKPYIVTGPVTVSQQVPAPVDDGAGLPAALQTASRIKASLDPDTALCSWDGHSRRDAHGKEYAIDLGDGYSALFRPHAGNDDGEYSLRGQLEIHAPTGPGHGGELVHRLGQLNLVNKPMSAAEGEWTYLNNNIAAQGMNDPSVGSAVAAATHLEELQLQEIFHQKAHLAAGLDEAGLRSLAREFQLEAAARCLPKKVRLVREAVAKASGYESGMDLAACPGYDPVPKRSGGWLTWGRFDVTGSLEGTAAVWKGKRLVHEVSSGGLAGMLTTGVLACTERRAVMGISPGKGMSESNDKFSGGANAVFLRVRGSGAGSGPKLVWDDPRVLMGRSDYYAYQSDHFGCVNPKSHHGMDGLTRDPKKIATFKARNNEVMFRNGIDLLGAEAPSRIICGSATERTTVLALLAQRGITHLGGKPVTEVVLT